MHPGLRVEELALPTHSSGYNHVTFEEHTMLEMILNVEGDVYAAENQK